MAGEYNIDRGSYAEISIIIVLLFLLVPRCCASSTLDSSVVGSEDDVRSFDSSFENRRRKFIIEHINLKKIKRRLALSASLPKTISVSFNNKCENNNNNNNNTAIHFNDVELVEVKICSDDNNKCDDSDITVEAGAIKNNPSTSTSFYSIDTDTRKSTFSLSSCDDNTTAIPATTNTSSSSTSSLPLCSICLGHLEDGEDMASSRNEQCTHTFHQECIIQWLLRHDDCPCCRRVYLMSSSEKKR